MSIIYADDLSTVRERYPGMRVKSLGWDPVYQAHKVWVSEESGDGW